MRSKVILKGHIIVSENELNVVKEALVHHKKLTSEEAGCLVFDVTQCQINRYRFDVYEEFVDSASFEFHQQRVKASDWGRVSINVERYYKIIH